MILSGVDIKEALSSETLIIDPPPDSEHIDTSTVDLRVGDEFYEWNPDLVKQAGVNVTVDIDNFDFKKLSEPYLVQVEKQSKGLSE